MKTLKEYLLEVSILGDIDDQIEAGDDAFRNMVIKFIKENYRIIEGKFIVSNEPNKNGLYEVSSDGNVIVTNRNVTSLTNGLFKWTIIDNYFDCNGCKSLVSLEGAPNKVGGYFSCSGCLSLKSLKGAPKEIKRSFECSYCESLKSLEGAPEKVGGDFWCSYCKSLESLEGAPKKIGGNFNCYDCKIKFTEDDVKDISKIKGKITV